MEFSFLSFRYCLLSYVLCLRRISRVGFSKECFFSNNVFFRALKECLSNDVFFKPLKEYFFNEYSFQALQRMFPSDQSLTDCGLVETKVAKKFNFSSSKSTIFRNTILFNDAFLFTLQRKYCFIQGAGIPP